ncbi:11613_t:CDS:2 [Dentiscutata heterogama]|uniref:11613_t:CDS:1 n=1 Tax=Dentiscutata heterogama TaxID=1316150 RepID=A0ACA9KA99_9GLOM|nr:11613_t:CDS:2 [Dentiscutata heterogama]
MKSSISYWKVGYFGYLYVLFPYEIGSEMAQTFDMRPQRQRLLQRYKVEVE